MSTPAPGYATPPQQLVTRGVQQLGRFDGPVQRNNLLDARYGLRPRALRALRLKEWQALQISTPRLFCNLALFDAKLLSLLQVRVYDKQRKQKHLHERQLPPWSFVVPDQVLESQLQYRDRHSTLVFHNHFASGRIEVELEVSATKHSPRMQGRLRVHTDRGASQLVSLPLPNGGGMCSHKGMFPVSGQLSIGDETHELSAATSTALLDDHKGYYPRVMEWDWVTSASVAADAQHRGFNLTRNQCPEPDKHNENCGWVGEQVGRLPAVSFTRENVGSAAERWVVRDREGDVELVFTPEVPGDVHVNALVVESRYRGPFGSFEGRLRPEGLPPIEVHQWFGMGEQFWLRC